MKKIILVLFIIVLFACATGTSLITGTARPPIDPAEVVIYAAPPP